MIDWLHNLSHEIVVVGAAELIPTFGVLTLGFAVFSYRRWQDTKALSLYAEELSMIDPMTNLPNRRAVQRLLNQINEKKEYPVGVAMISIEGLENIRSTLGLTVAEHVLIEILYHISKNLTGEQLIAHWQANQFVCLCPGMDHQQAVALNNKLKNVAISKDKLVGQPLKCSTATCSVSNKAELENVFEQ